MPILQTFKCDFRGCEAQHTEATVGEGAQGWGQVSGIVLHGKDNPLFCPAHLSLLAEFIHDVMEINS